MKVTVGKANKKRVKIYLLLLLVFLSILFSPFIIISFFLCRWFRVNAASYFYIDDSDNYCDCSCYTRIGFNGFYVGGWWILF